MNKIITIEPLELEIHEGGLGWMFFECMKKNSKKIGQFLADTNESETYETILTKSIRTAVKLQHLGLNEDEVICICSSNTGNSVIPFIAAQFLRNIVASLDPQLSLEDIIHLLKQIQPKIIFSSENALHLIENALRKSGLSSTIVVFEFSRKYLHFSQFIECNFEAENDFEPVCRGSNGDTAVIFFSSGSTGLPKGICISHYTLIIQCLHTNHRLSFNTQFPVFLNYTSLYWISSVKVLICCLFSGAAQVICSKFDNKQWWKLVENYKVSYAFLPPNYAKEILQQHMQSNTSSLEIFTVGGSSVSKKLISDLIKTFPTSKIVHVYGLTEIGGVVLNLNVTKTENILTGNENVVSCGRGIPGVSYKITNCKSGELLGPNQIGELCLKSKMVMNGYYNQDSSNAFDEHGWLKTGDLAFYDSNLNFYVVDRLKDMFKYKSWHIIPMVLETILCSHPAVQEAIVIGIPKDIDGDHPMGLVVLKQHWQVDEKDLEKFVEDRVLERQRLRAGVKIVDGFPKTCTGKIKRKTVRDMIVRYNEL